MSSLSRDVGREEVKGEEGKPRDDGEEETGHLSVSPR